MENQDKQEIATPPECFRQEEVEQLQSFESQILADVNYYLWLDVDGDRPYRFLFALELIFGTGESLLLSSGEDSEAIRIVTAASVVATAAKLQHIHGQPTIQRMARAGQGIWQTAVGKKLEAVQLARHDNGLYANDALMLDFGSTGVVVELPEAGEGLEIREV